MGRDAGGRPHKRASTALLWAFLMLASLPVRAMGTSKDTGRSAPLEDVLTAIRACIAKRPVPWPIAWQEEYVNTVRGAISSHSPVPQYAERLQIIHQGFPAYWADLRKGKERSLFEVQRAEIRWYVETLMRAEFPGPQERQKLRDQWRGLMDDAAAALAAQFPFLDPNLVQAAKADYLAKCEREIERPLLPILQRPLSEEQIGQLKERWHSLRYARVDLWRQLGGGRRDSDRKNAGTANLPIGPLQGAAQESGVPRGVPGTRVALGTPAAPSDKEHPDYLLTQRSLDQLRGQLWSLLGGFPDYYRQAVAKEIAAQKERLRSQSEARAQEARLGVAVWQTEYLSFLLAALLETADIPEGATHGLGESRSSALPGEIHEDR